MNPNRSPLPRTVRSTEAALVTARQCAEFLKVDPKQAGTTRLALAIHSADAPSTDEPSVSPPTSTTRTPASPEGTSDRATVRPRSGSMPPALMHTLSVTCLVASGLSIAAAVAIWMLYRAGDAAHAERFGIFVGLWAPTFLVLSSRLRPTRLVEGTNMLIPAVGSRSGN